MAPKLKHIFTVTVTTFKGHTSTALKSKWSHVGYFTKLDLRIKYIISTNIEIVD